MEEINQLLEKLKKDQEVLYDEFKEQVLRAYSGQQKKYADESLKRLKTIIESIFGIADLFVKTNKDYNVAARSIFDHIINTKEVFSYQYIGKETNRDRTTVMHSVKNYQSFKNTVEYKTKYESIIILYAKYKSEL